jgi:acetolactate synthase-1/2/3 large subunit
MPGTQNLAIYDAFHTVGQDLRHFLIRNEQSATFMAGGFARVTGEVGVAITVPGPGASNAATGLVDAQTDCQPVLLITGGVERPIQYRDRSKMFHGLDQASFFKPIVRYYGCPQTAAQVPQTVRAAFAAIWASRPGPAVIEIPPDVAAEQTNAPCIPHRIVPRVDKLPNPGAVQDAAKLLRQAKRPVILAGGDVIHCSATHSLDRFAKKLGAPVIETRLGKGSLAGDHPLSVGNSRHKRARAVLEAADTLIAVGTRLTQIDTANWHIRIPPCFLQIDRDAAEIGREVPVTAGLAGDLTQSIDLLLQVLGTSHVPADWGGLIQQTQEKYRRPAVPVLSDIRRVLARDGILAADITSLSYRAFDEYPVFGPRDFVYSCHYVAMGCGLPFALGAKIACPNRPVVALCGDGGLLMSIGELATAAQYNIAAVIVVVVDRSLVAIKASQIKNYAGRLIDTDLPGPDFVRLAEAFGVAGFRAAELTQLLPLLDEALRSNRPTVIEVDMTGHESEIMQQIPWLTGE